MTSQHMTLALALAQSVYGTTSPNPAVGCVIVRDNKVIGQGATQPPGGPHAEVMALRAAGERAKGATVFVSLEPCSHFGRTPPCADRLIAAGVSRVIIALMDPDENVSGGGIRRLQAAGINVSLGDGDIESRALLEGYFKHRTTGMPYVTVKFAATLDGKIAASSGDSRWVAGEEARAFAHDFRTQVDAIMCGVNNVLLDDPQLTARPGGLPAERQPLRVVADSRGRTPPTAKVLGPGGKTLIATTDASSSEWRDEIKATGGEVLVVPAGEDGRVHLGVLVQELGDRGVLSLLAEGGGELHGSLFSAGLVDRVHAILAPKILGGTAFPAVGGTGVARMSDAVQLKDVEVRRLGEDLLVTGHVRPD